MVWLASYVEMWKFDDKKLLVIDCSFVPFLLYVWVGRIYSNNKVHWRAICSCNPVGARSSMWRIWGQKCFYRAYTATRLLPKRRFLETSHNSVTNLYSRRTGGNSRCVNMPCQGAVSEVWWWTERMDWDHWRSSKPCKFWRDLCKVPGSALLWVCKQKKDSFYCNTMIKDVEQSQN